MSSDSEYILETKSLVKEFKGFVAVNGVSLKVRRGSIQFNGTDITGERPAQIARRGIVGELIAFARKTGAGKA